MTERNRKNTPEMYQWTDPETNTLYWLTREQMEEKSAEVWAKEKAAKENGRGQK